MRGLPPFGPVRIAAPELSKLCGLLLAYTDESHKKHPYESGVYDEDVFEGFTHLLSEQ